MNPTFKITGANHWVLETFALTEDALIEQSISAFFANPDIDVVQILHDMTPDHDHLIERITLSIANVSRECTMLIRESADTGSYSITFAEAASTATENSLIVAIQKFIADISQHQNLESINESLQQYLHPLNIGVFCTLVQEPHSVTRQLKDSREVEVYDFLGVWVFGRKISLHRIADSQTMSRLFGISDVQTHNFTTQTFFETFLDPIVSKTFADRFSMAGLNNIFSFPLYSRNDVIGMMSFMGPFVASDTLQHINIYLHFIEAIFAQLYERAVLETQVLRLQRMNSHINALSQNISLDGLFSQIAKACIEIFEATHAFVLLRDGDDYSARIEAAVGADLPRKIRYPWHNLELESKRSGVEELSLDPFLSLVQEQTSIAVTITVPLIQNARCYAVIYIANIHEELLSTGDVLYAQQFGEYVASYHARLNLSQSLDRSEKRYRFLLNESSNPVFVVNQYDQILHFNHAGRRLVGIDDEADIMLCDILTDSSLETWHREKVRLIDRDVDTILWQGEALNILHQTKTPFEAEVICIRQGEGQVEFLITIQDISHRLKVEQQHRLRENELDLFQHITSVVNSTLNLDELLDRALDIFDEVNFGSMYGILLLDENHIPYLAAHRHVPDAMLERIMEDPITLRGGLDLVLSNTEQDDYTSVVSVKSILNNELIAQFGNLIGAKISVDKKTIGAVLAARPFVSAPDFTPRDMQILHAIANQLARGITNARLHLSLQLAADRNSMLYNEAEKIRAHLSTVIENSPDALVLLQRDTWSMRLLNEDPFVLWGYVHGSLQQQTLHSICAPEQISAMNQHLSRIGIQPSYSFECGLLRADGTTFTALISANIVSAAEVLLSIRDITPMRILENRIQQREKLALLGQMIASVAHELNNPIAVIRGIAQLQLLHPQTAELKHDFEVIDRTSQRAGRIVQQLRRLGQPQKNEYVQVDLREIIDHIAMQNRSVFAQADIEYRFYASESDYFIYGDAGQIEQVLVNLVDNAVRAMQEVEGHRRLVLRLQSSAHYVDLVVEDSGSGIDIGTRARLFEPFYTTRKVGDGLGLGLAIVHTIVTQHHGTITYENRPSGGTRCTIALPSIHAPRLTITKQSVASNTYLTVIELLNEILNIPVIEVESLETPSDMLVIDASLLQSYPAEVLSHRFLCIISPRAMVVPSYPDTIVVVCTPTMDAALIRQQLHTLVTELILP